MKTLAITLAAALLAACGGGSPGVDTTMQHAVPPPSGAAFFATVQELVRTTPDDTEPAGVDGIASDDSADGEPQALE